MNLYGKAALKCPAHCHIYPGKRYVCSSSDMSTAPGKIFPKQLMCELRQGNRPLAEINKFSFHNVGDPWWNRVTSPTNLAPMHILLDRIIPLTMGNHYERGPLKKTWKLKHTVR